MTPTAGYGYPMMGPYWGAQAEYLRVSWDDFKLLELPAGTEHENAFTMLSDIFPAGYHGTELAQVGPGDTVAIFGAGPVGLMAAHNTALRGASQVFVVDKQPDRLLVAQRFGATADQPRRDRPTEVIIDGTDGFGVDCGVEAVGYRLGIDPAERDVVLLTHLHIDHSGDLAPVVFAAWMARRHRPLILTGPAGDGAQPGVDRWSELLFGREDAWSYLHSFEGTPRAAPSGCGAVRTVLEVGELRVSSVAVPHGMMPAVAYRIEDGTDSVTISGDVQRLPPPLAELARATTLLVHDLALPERDVPHGDLHAKPSAVGRLTTPVPSEVSPDPRYCIVRYGCPDIDTWLR